MSKRNLILLIIVLVGIVIGILGFLTFSTSPNTNTNSNNSTPSANIFSNIFKFGLGKPTPAKNGGPAPVNVSGYIPEENGSPSPNSVQKLMQISSMPIAGFGIFMKERFVELPTVTPTTTDTTATEDITKTKDAKPTPPPTEFVPTLKYVAISTGNVYETFADKIEEHQLTTTMVPKIYDAYFGSKCDSVLMRYLNDDGKTIETFIGTLPKENLGEDTTSDNQIKGVFLPENISNINISPDNSRLFYLFNLAQNNGSAGVVANSLSADKKLQVFTSPFTEWNSWWANNKMITMTTKPSSEVVGYMYTLDPDKKTFNKVLGNIKGLTTLASPNGKLILYSDNRLVLNVYNIDTKESTSIGIRTLPEKCVWGKLSDFIYCAVPSSSQNSSYPDNWYQGEVSFKDQIWKVEIKDGTTNLISDLSESKKDIDGIKLALDDNENYLFFVNKKDSYLWELNLK